MTQLGSYPSGRYGKSWVTQRLVNRAPSWAHSRMNSMSLGQQLLNPIGLEIQETLQQLAQARYNSFLSTADVSLLDHLYKIELTTGVTFQSTEDSSGVKAYVPPRVYATINSIEYELTQAEKNNIETLAYDNLPSRIEYSDVTYLYSAVIDEVSVSGLSAVTPGDLPFSSHLYVTLKNNTSWETRTTSKIYYPKCYITGLTRKGTEETEAVPLRYNGTFKTINEWQEVTSVFVSYLDAAATIAIDVFPFNRESYLDLRNICVPNNASEKIQFTKLNDRTWGSSFVVESFTVSDMDVVRTVDLTEKESLYELELLDETDNNVTLADFIHRPNSRFIYAIDSTTFYVYDTSLQYPSGVNLEGESPETKINLVSDQWVVARDEEATIKTQNRDLANPPYRVRWTVLTPSGTEYYMGLDGSLWSTTTDAWVDNDSWSEGRFTEQQIEFALTENGDYVVTLEADYIDESTKETTTLKTKFLFTCPAINPEVQFDLPLEMTGATNIGIDSDQNIWVLNYNGIHKLDLFFDYFLVDYENNRIWLKEEYSSVRVTV
jgi:hypothetical protein